MSTENTPDPGDVLTLAEAAAFLKCHPRTVLRMLHDGKLPAARVGSNWRLSRAALTRYLSGELVLTAPGPQAVLSAVVRAANPPPKTKPGPAALAERFPLGRPRGKKRGKG